MQTSRIHKALFFLFFCTPQIGETRGDIKSALKVEFQRPEVLAEQKNGLWRVLIKGRASTQVKVFFSQNQIRYISKDIERSIQTEMALLPSSEDDSIKEKPIAESDKEGNLSFELWLPEGRITLRLSIENSERNLSSRRRLSFRVKEPKSFRQKTVNQHLGHYGFSLGTGASFLLYEQSLTSIGQGVDFTKFSFPFLRLESYYRFNKSWRTLLSYSRSVARLDSQASDLALSSLDMSQTSIKLEGIYTPYFWSGFRWIGAGVFHSVFSHSASANLSFRWSYDLESPGIVQRTSSNSAEIDNINIGLLGLGVQLDIFVSEKVMYEAYLKYLYPIHTSGVEEVSSMTAMEGSVGGHYLLGKNWSIGLFFHGKILFYKYDGLPDSVSSTSSGGQTQTSSNIEARLGWRF